MKRFFCLVLVCSIFLLGSCSAMMPVIPNNSTMESIYFENMNLFVNCVDEIREINYDCLISRNDYYSVEGSEAINGIYIQNMNNLSVSEYQSEQINQLYRETDVKLIDSIRTDDLFICVFDLCKPDKNYDYGIYFVSEDKPIYFGDPSMALQETENGYIYEQKASYGTRLTYFTKKISENYYYYEIS